MMTGHFYSMEGMREEGRIRLPIISSEPIKRHKLPRKSK